MDRKVDSRIVAFFATSLIFCLLSGIVFAVGGATQKKAVEGFRADALDDYVTQDGVVHHKYLICHASGVYPCEVDYLSAAYQNIFVENWTKDSMDTYNPPINTIIGVQVWAGDTCSNNPGVNGDCEVDNTPPNGPHYHMLYGNVALCSGRKDHLKTVHGE